MSEFILPHPEVFEPPTNDLLTFLMKQPGVTDVKNPAATRLFFGLEGTLFRPYQYSSAFLAGSWRPDTPELIEGLHENGYAASIVCVSGIRYATAALRICAEQFNADESEWFDDVFSLSDFSHRRNRYEAFPGIADHTSREQGKGAVFIDSAALLTAGFRACRDFSYIHVPPEYQYNSIPARMHQVPWPNTPS